MVKILWVDDEIELLKPHVLFLRGKGYEVDTCNNGYDAIDMATEGNYDLIILDEMMPGMTGLETLPKIKEIRPTTPVIMVTKSEEENIMDKAVGSKIADYLIKPVNPNQVLLSIKKNVHSQQLVTEQTTADYRSEFLSKGGAVYSRQQKSITLSPEARLALNCRSERLSPNELIRPTWMRARSFLSASFIAFSTLRTLELYSMSMKSITTSPAMSRSRS